MNVQEIIKDIREKFGRAGLERVEECLLILTGKSAPKYLHDEQEATRLFFPHLAAKPWHEAESFAWAGKIEARWREIKAEFESLREEKITFYPYQDQYTGDLGWTGWHTWHLYRKGEVTETARRLCPKTLECLEQSPHGLREGIFSVFQPGTHLLPHTGGVNLVLTVHLPLFVPPDCALKVADETRVWEEGKLLIFDDSFIHEAWNRSAEARVVLLWDIWHPDLTDIEIRVLTYLFPRLEAFLTAN